MLAVLVLEASKIIVILESFQIKSYSEIKHFYLNWKITCYYVVPLF